jgi:AraC family transcriptional regulator
MLQVKKQDTFKYYESKVLAVKDIVKTNIHRNLTVEQLAVDTCVSYYHLRDIFYAIEGCPIKQYINNYRIRTAAELLQTTDSTLDDIAMQVGYINKCSLSKAFKKVFGCSPGQFRQKSKHRTDGHTALSKEVDGLL